MHDAASKVQINFGAVPAELKTRRQWVLWRAEGRSGKSTKVPYSINGKRARPNDLSTCSSFDEVVTAYKAGGFAGIGFVFAPKGGLVGIDLDGCRNPNDGSLDDWAREILERFPTYAEVSPSGTGVKLFLNGTLPTPKTGAKTNEGNRPRGPGYGGKAPGIEAYHAGRFFVFTGWKLKQSPGAVRAFGDNLHAWFQEQFCAKPTDQTSTASLTQVFESIEARVWIVERAKAYLKKLRPSISGQRGHDRAFHVACVLRCGFGLSFDEAWSTIVDWNATCDPPWAETELRHKLNEAGKQPVTLELALANRPRHLNPDTGLFESNGTISTVLRAPIERFTIGELQDKFTQLNRTIIEGHLREGETANIISTSKIGKSWFLYDLLLRIVTGGKWLDRYSTSPGRVLLIDNELHKATLAHRLKTVADALGIRRVDYGDLIDVWPLRGNLRNLYELAEEFAGIPRGEYCLIALDAKYRMGAEGTSENDNAAETRFYNQVDRYAETTGASMAMTHHSGKGSQAERRVTDVGSGAGAQSRAADAHLVMREHQEPNCVVLESAVRSFAPVEPVVLRWDFPLWTVADDLDPTQLKKVGHGSPHQGAQDRTSDETVLSHCQTWRTRTELRRLTGFGDTRLDRSIARLSNSGFLEKEEQKRNGNSCLAFRKSIHAR